MPQQPHGLIFCVNNWSDTFCITQHFLLARKSIEFMVSFLILLFLIHSFILRFCKERQANFFCIVYILMMIALLCTFLINVANCVFTLDHRIRTIMYIQSYVYDIYFTTIVYQVSSKLVQLKKGSQYYKWIWLSIRGLLIFFLLFLTVTFIVRNIFTYYDCEQTWFLVINLFGISLSVLMVIAGKFYSKFQAQRIQGMVKKNTKNPLPEVWKWIIINIACQFFRFLRSFIYIISPYNCNFSASYTLNEILGLFFDVFSFHVGMIATIYFFQKRIKDDAFYSKQFESSIRERIDSVDSKQIQMELTGNNKAPESDPMKPKKRDDKGKDSERFTEKLFIDEEGRKRESKDEGKLQFFSI